MKARIGLVLTLFCVIALISPLAAFAAGKVEKLENPNVKVFFWFDPNEDEKAAIKYFEDTWGGKLNYTANIPWDNLELKTLAAMAAGDPPDALVMTSQQFPRYAVKKVAQPLDAYLDVNDPMWAKNITDLFAWEGKHYAVNRGMDAVYIWYNKTMFEDNGLKTPMQYAKEGKWNFENFRKVAMALTQDTNKDGKPDQWGYMSWMYEVFVLANGGKFIQYTPDGKILFAMDDPKTLAGLQFMQDGYFKDKYIPLDANTKSFTDFPAGKVAMMAERGYIAQWYLKDKVKFEWDVAPFPTGPGNVGGVSAGDAQGWGIVNGAKNPKGGAAFIYAWYKYFKDNDAKIQAKYFTPDQYKVIADAAKKATAGMYNGIGNWWNMQWNFWGEIFAGANVSSTVAKYKPQFQTEIDLTLADKTLPEIRSFKPVPAFDFESGDTKGVVSQGLWGTDSVGITKDAKEIVAGAASLKIAATKGGEWSMLVRTDPAVLDLPAFHTYGITFDYRILSDTAADGYYFIVIRPVENLADGKVNFGWVTIPGKKAGDTGKFEGSITIDKASQNNAIAIGGFKIGSIVIDNLKVVEK